VSLQNLIGGPRQRTTAEKMDERGLTFDVPAPPQEWIKSFISVDIAARIISLWETTVFLIVNRTILCRDQQRYLAMLRDHRVSRPCNSAPPARLKAL
jgi:hypothetical protein